MRSVAILGATGSIGGQALDIIENPDQFRAAVLTAYASAEQYLRRPGLSPPSRRAGGFRRPAFPRT